MVCDLLPPRDKSGASTISKGSPIALFALDVSARQSELLSIDSAADDSGMSLCRVR